MIGWLQGVVIEKKAPDLLLNVNGVGYELQAPMTSFYAWENSEQITLYTHLAVREDAQQLYGFATRDERSLFRYLIKVSGIGPKSGLMILSGMDVQRFVQCIQNEDINALIKIPGIGPKSGLMILSGMDVQRFVQCIQNEDINALIKIPGIGRKTAERLLIEMRDKLKDFFNDSSGTLADGTPTNAPAVDPSRMMLEEAESALIALGYKPQDAAKMIQAVNSDEISSAEALIRAALKRMI